MLLAKNMDVYDNISKDNKNKTEFQKGSHMFHAKDSLNTSPPWCSNILMKLGISLYECITNYKILSHSYLY